MTAISLAGIVSTSGTVNAEQRTTMRVINRQDTSVHYRLYATGDMDKEGKLESNDSVSGGKAEGYLTVKGAEDVYSYTGRLEYAVFDGLSEIEVVCSDGFNFWERGKLDITSSDDNFGLGYEVEMTDAVHRPGDGTLEWQDNVVDGDTADGEIRGGHDHWNTDGEIRRIRCDPDDRQITINHMDGGYW